MCKINSQWKFAVGCRELNSVLCDSLEEWEGGLRRRGLMYTYGWFMLIYGRNQHSIVKQLSSNWKYINLKINKRRLRRNGLRIKNNSLYSKNKLCLARHRRIPSRNPGWWQELLAMSFQVGWVEVCQLQAISPLRISVWVIIGGPTVVIQNPWERTSRSTDREPVCSMIQANL